jgi:hypothetical protein
MMAKVVYTADYGGFGLSHEAIARYSELKDLGLTRIEGHWSYPDGEWFYDREITRHDSVLAQVVEELGREADGPFAELCIREVPDGSRYRIQEYDGFESVILESEEEWCVAE